LNASINKLPENFLNQLQKKLLFTVGFLAIYRVGVHVPVPGVDTEALAKFFEQQGANMLGMLNMFTGGGLQRFSIFALGVMPYITASIISQLLTVMLPQLEALSKEGEAGRKKITQYTRYGTVILSLFQGFMLARTLESIPLGGQQILDDGGFAWQLFAAVTLAAGTSFVMWLGEQITEKGVGNGISLIIFSSIVAGLPGIVANTYQEYNSQQMNLFSIIILISVVVVVVACVVFVEQGSRLISIQYAKRQIGKKIFGGQSSFLPIKVNTSGVIPPIFASSVLNAPFMIARFSPDSWFGSVFMMFIQPGNWFYNFLYVFMIVFFAFFYTSIVFKADDIAENLKKHGGFIPGIRPGARTAEYLDSVIARLTLSGAVYLSLICVLPTILTARFNIQFYFGGTSLLIVVGVALETFRQVESHRQSLKYEAFMKKGSAVRPK